MPYEIEAHQQTLVRVRPAHRHRSAAHTHDEHGPGRSRPPAGRGDDARYDHDGGGHRWKPAPPAADAQHGGCLQRRRLYAERGRHVDIAADDGEQRLPASAAAVEHAFGHSRRRRLHSGQPGRRRGATTASAAARCGCRPEPTRAESATADDRRQ